MSDNDKELSPREKARIASRAQAAAHKALRERYPEDYKQAYQAEKERLSARATGSKS